MNALHAAEPEILRPAGVPDQAILRVFRVPPEAAGMRLDRFLQSQLRSTSRTKARAIVEHSAFAPDGRRHRPSDRVRAEERVVLWRPPFETEQPEPEVSILYEDQHLLALDKPPLVTVHPTARSHRHTLIKRLQAQRPGEFLSLIHRLDRETSGLILVAKSVAADRGLKRLLEHRSLSLAEARQPWQTPGTDSVLAKTYLAITWGVPPSGLLDLPLEADAGNPLRVKMRVGAPGRGLHALTTFTVRDVRAGYALVACELHTGRQHQIRVHLAALGCPVVGDKLYGPDERLLARAADGELTDQDRRLLELERHALHAHRYRLRHPITGRTLDLVSPLPRDLAEFWEHLDSHGSPGRSQPDLEPTGQSGARHVVPPGVDSGQNRR
jgi:23S rRNA pseudouridine1911/1915/1917 synthase